MIHIFSVNTNTENNKRKTVILPVPPPHSLSLSRLLCVMQLLGLQVYLFKHAFRFFTYVSRWLATEQKRQKKETRFQVVRLCARVLA